MKKTIKNLLLAGTLIPCVLTTNAYAAWPSDAPIEVVVGFAPGGTTDAMARNLAPYIQKHLGNGARLVIINRPGAGGEIAASHVQRAKPDGYTIGVVNLPGYFFLPMYRSTSYNPSEMALVARVISDPTIMVTRKDGPLPNVKSLVEQLKKSPESVSAGHNGVGTNGHLAIVGFNEAAGVTLNAIPYSGNAQQKVALAGQHLDIGFQSASEMLDPEKEAIPMRVLALFTANRMKHLPDVPTTYDFGYQVEMTAERGFAAPKGVPEPILQRLQKAVEAAMEDPEYIQAARNDAPFLSFLDGASWTEKVDQYRQAYEPVANAFAKEIRQ